MSKKIILRIQKFLKYILREIERARKILLKNLRI